MSIKRIHVAAGIIWNQQRDKILIAKRPEHLHKGGYWEFPGGKLEQGETVHQALARELLEELSLRFANSEFFQRIEHDYPEKQVCLDFCHVLDLLSAEQANEGQELAWVAVQQLREYQFPEANVPIVDKLIQQYG